MEKREHKPKGKKIVRPVKKRVVKVTKKLFRNKIEKREWFEGGFNSMNDII